MATEELLKTLARASRHPLSSPPRLAVMLLLVARGAMEFSRLQKALGMTPGNLWSHLEKLKSQDYISTKYVFSPAGPRLVVEPTEKGIRETIAYAELLRRLLSGKEKPPD